MHDIGLKIRLWDGSEVLRYLRIYLEVMVKRKGLSYENTIIYDNPNLSTTFLGPLLKMSC